MRVLCEAVTILPCRASEAASRSIEPSTWHDAERYVDVFARFCVDGPDACDYAVLRRHYYREGRAEGRVCRCHPSNQPRD